MTQRHQITRAAELESLPVFRSFIDLYCQEHPGIDDSVRYELKLAVDEASTNIITHGYAGMNPGSIILCLELEPSQVTLTLTDFGHSFEPNQAPLPDLEAGLEDRPMGGFGLFFIYQTMNEVSYQASNCGNILTFIKRLDSPAGE